jgi:glycosyltransferase involved in cell wall biosynthesis
VLRSLAASDPHVRLVLFRRNYGQTAAMAAGFRACRGNIIVSMDGDLQNDPADIGRLVERLEQGFDVVCGWRRHRQDRVATRLLPSRIANLLIARVTGARIHDTGCSLKAYRSWVVRSLHLYSDMHRFLAALGVGLGARIAELPVRHHPRRAGKSKYGLGRIFPRARRPGRHQDADPVLGAPDPLVSHPVAAAVRAAAAHVRARLRQGHPRSGEWLLFGDDDMAAVAAGSVALLVAA